MIICPGREVRTRICDSMGKFVRILPQRNEKTGILKYSTDEVNMTQPLINSEIVKKSFNVSKLRFLHLKRGSNTQLIGLL